MNAYTQQEQVEIVHQAMLLTNAIQLEKEELSKVMAERYPAPPARPVLKEVKLKAPDEPKLPSVEYTTSDYIKDHKKTLYIWIGVMVISLGGALPGLLLWLYYAYRQAKKVSEVKRLEAEKSPEYLQSLADYEQAKEKYNEDLARAKEESMATHQNEIEVYENSIVPKYKEEKSEWEKKQTQIRNALSKDIELNESTLNNLYDTTKLISVSYRDLRLLEWLYDDMRSSDHDIKYATELLDRDRQRVATMGVGVVTQNAINNLQNALHNDLGQLYSAIEYGNSILEDISEETKKLRNCANVLTGATVVNAYDTHKILKAIE